MPPLSAAGAQAIAGAAKGLISPAGPVRVSNLMAGFMIGIAALLDAIQALAVAVGMVIPLVGWAIVFLVPLFVAIMGAIIFRIWFLYCNVNCFTGKRAGMKIAATFGSIVLECTPLFDGLPGIMGGVVTTIVASRLEDAEQPALRQQARGLDAEYANRSASVPTPPRTEEEPAQTGDQEEETGGEPGPGEGAQNAAEQEEAARRRRMADIVPKNAPLPRADTPVSTRRPQAQASDWR